MATYIFGGSAITKPGVYSVSDVSAYVAPNYNATGIIGAIGEARGGTPNTIYSIASPSCATSTFKSGTLADGISLMFTGGAYQIKAIRVAGAGYLQASGIFADSAAASCMVVTAKDYGTIGNYIKVRFSAATNSGKKIDIYDYWSGDTEQFDDLQNLFSVSYTGTACATTGSVTLTVTVVAGSATTIAASVAGATGMSANFTIDMTLTAYATVADVFETISNLTDFSVSQSAYCDDMTLPSSSMDAAVVVLRTTANVTAVATIASQLGTLIHTLSSYSTLVTGAKFSSTVTLPPATATAYTTLSSGNDGAAVAASNFESALATLEGQDVDIVWVASGDADDQAELFSHVTTMSSVKNRRERIGVVGLDTTANTTAEYEARALTFNSERMVVVAPGIKITTSGVLTAKPSYYTAALLAGAIAAQPIKENVTYKPVSVQDLTDYYSISDIEDLMSHGVTVLEYDRRAGFRWNNGFTTYIATSNAAKQEINAVRIIDSLSKDMRSYLEDRFIGKAMTQSIAGDLYAAANTILRQYADTGALVGSDTLAPYRNITVTVSNGIAIIRYEASPASTLNYIFVQQTFAPAYPWVSTTIS